MQVFEVVAELPDYGFLGVLLIVTILLIIPLVILAFLTGMTVIERLIINKESLKENGNKDVLAYFLLCVGLLSLLIPIAIAINFY